MAEILSLVRAPTDTEEVQQSVVELLEKTLAFAKEGKIDSVILLVGRSDGHWYPAYSETCEFSRDIGRLEILKQQWIRDVLRNNDL